MPQNRFYINQIFEKDSQCNLTGDEYKHLKVMRCAENELVELVNGKGQLGVARITAIEISQAKLSIERIEERSPTKKVILAQALLKPKNLELVIEKGTELGATEFWLFPGEKSEKKELSPNQKKRLEHLTISAMKQCGRLDLPQILEKEPLGSWSALPTPLAYYGDLDPKAPPLRGPNEDVILFIGPEKGFSKNEENSLIQLRVKGIRLSPNTLRSETAALCALSQVTN